MKGSKDLLSSVLKTTQMGQVGIHYVLKTPLNASLRKELRSQLQEYDAIEQEAQTIASNRGWILEELDPTVKFMAGMTARAKLRIGNPDSKAAAMMIQGNTRGMIKSLKNMHHFCGNDEKVCRLSQKLLDCEVNNIRQMQGFL